MTNRLTGTIERKCPKCGYFFGMVKAVGAPLAKPAKDDCSMCSQCGTFLKFDDHLNLVELTGAEFVKLDAKDRELMQLIHTAWEASHDPAKDKNWTEQVKKMSENAKAWRKANPGRDAKVQFNYPRNIMVVAPISVAIKKKYVSADIAGLELIRSLWRQDDKTEPTVFMVRMAIELSDTSA